MGKPIAISGSGLEPMLSRSDIASWLRQHQHRLRAGDKLPSLTEIARMAGLHRDTLYVAMGGEDHISFITQARLSVILQRVESNLLECGPQRTRLMHVQLCQEPSLRFGCAAIPLLRKR